MYKDKGFNPIERFSIECGNVYYFILDFIQKYYPSISANLTLGNISKEGIKILDLTQSKCLNWLKNGTLEESLRFHTWLTIGDNYIIDCTIGTFINIHISQNKRKNLKDDMYGGLIYGIEGNLDVLPFQQLNNNAPNDISNIQYIPIIMGREAFIALAPKY